jgi:hypothetical protein
MIYSIKQFPDKKFTDKMDLTRFIKKNIEDIQKAKLIEYKNNANKAIDINHLEANFTPKIEDITGDIIEVKALINSTNLIDSHTDLHTFKTWNKSAKEAKTTYALQEHQNKFTHVMSRKALNTNEVMNFKDFGLSDMDFTANISTFTLSRKDNPFMFDQYAQGKVTNHSVGMLYVMGKIELAYYDEDSEKNMDFFEKAKAQAINPEVADEYGYFWVVSEAVKREGSAVVFGSNPITPTLEVKNYEPSNHSKSNKNEPSQGTQKQLELKQFLELIKI